MIDFFENAICLNGHRSRSMLIVKMLVWGLFTTSAAGDDGIDSMMSRMKGRAVDHSQIFDRLGVTAIGSRSDDPEKKFHVSYDQLEWNVWRYEYHADVVEGELDDARMRTKDFIFAGHRIGDGDYVFRKLEFIKSRSRTYELSHFPFATRATRIAGNSLHAYLSFKGTEMSFLENLPAHAGRPVEGVAFQNKLVRGQIKWLPDDGYMITEVEMVHNSPEMEGKPLSHSFINYRDYKGRLLPVQVESRSGNFSHVDAIKEIGPANPDPNFYTAESIGLTTPPRPVQVWLYWLVAAVVLLLAALVLMRKKSQVFKTA